MGSFVVFSFYYSMSNLERNDENLYFQGIQGRFVGLELRTGLTFTKKSWGTPPPHETALL